MKDKIHFGYNPLSSNWLKFADLQHNPYHVFLQSPDIMPFMVWQTQTEKNQLAK